MTTQTAPRITYRRTQRGEWVAFGPASAIRAGTTVTVTKASGETKNERIASAGRPFTANGQQMVYGYLDKNTSVSQAGTTWQAAAAQDRRNAEKWFGSASSSSRSSRPMCDECGERRAVTTATDMSGLTGDVCGICARSGALSFA